MTFLTVLRDTEISCSFKLVLEGKTGKEIPESSRLQFLEEFSAILISGLHLHLQYSRFVFVNNTIDNLPKVLRARFLGSNGLFFLLAYARLVASRTPLERLLACLNFTLDSEDLFCWYKRKKLVL